MTRDQIKSLINRKIFGQGNQVDLGTALPNILNAIMDLGASTEEVDDFENFDPTTPYSRGDVVRKEGKLYRFVQGHIGEWNPSKVAQTNIVEVIGIGTRVSVEYNQVSGTFSFIDSSDEAQVADAIHNGTWRNIQFIYAPSDMVDIDTIQTNAIYASSHMLEYSDKFIMLIPNADGSPKRLSWEIERPVESEEIVEEAVEEELPEEIVEEVAEEAE